MCFPTRDISLWAEGHGPDERNSGFRGQKSKLNLCLGVSTFTEPDLRIGPHSSHAGLVGNALWRPAEGARGRGGGLSRTA